MQHKLEWLPELDMQASDQETIKLMCSTSAAMLVQKEFEVIRMAHLTGTATEFQIQHLAFKHKQVGADATEASNKIQAILQGLGDEINSRGQLPQGIDQVQQHTR
eukprot:10876041-Karenia_brevis.AAC.1